MGKNVIILLICLLVAVAMGYILMVFTKRLRQLEEERWGDKARISRDAQGQKKDASGKKKK